ncbi:hypothetical protein PROFUN_07711, partial [Planoprotostelium fungivorum]
MSSNCNDSCCAQHLTSLTNWKTRRKVSENSVTKKHIQCMFIEKEHLGFLWFEIILYKQRLIELFGSYVVTIHHNSSHLGEDVNNLLNNSFGASEAKIFADIEAEVNKISNNDSINIWLQDWSIFCHVDVQLTITIALPDGSQCAFLPCHVQDMFIDQPQILLVLQSSGVKSLPQSLNVLAFLPLHSWCMILDCAETVSETSLFLQVLSIPPTLHLFLRMWVGSGLTPWFHRVPTVMTRGACQILGRVAGQFSHFSQRKVRITLNNSVCTLKFSVICTLLKLGIVFVTSVIYHWNQRVSESQDQNNTWPTQE